MWTCDCNRDKKLQDDEVCECGFALEIDDPNELLYELDEVMNKIEILSLKAKSLMKKYGYKIGDKPRN